MGGAWWRRANSRSQALPETTGIPGKLLVRARKVAGGPSFHLSAVVCRYSGDFSATVGTALAFVAKLSHLIKSPFG